MSRIFTGLAGRSQTYAAADNATATAPQRNRQNHLRCMETSDRCGTRARATCPGVGFRNFRRIASASRHSLQFMFSNSRSWIEAQKAARRGVLSQAPVSLGQSGRSSEAAREKTNAPEVFVTASAPVRNRAASPDRFDKARWPSSTRPIFSVPTRSSATFLLG